MLVSRLSTSRPYFFALALVRAFSCTSAIAFPKVAKEKPKKTKKLLSELSDAVSVKKGAPLPKWDGGLSKPTAKREWRCICGAHGSEYSIGRSSSKVKSGPKSDSKSVYHAGVNSVQTLTRGTAGQAKRTRTRRKTSDEAVDVTPQSSCHTLLPCSRLIVVQRNPQKPDLIATWLVKSSRTRTVFHIACSSLGLDNSMRCVPWPEPTPLLRIL